MQTSEGARRGTWSVAWWSLALIALPPLYVLLAGGPASGFAFVRGDAFLYLTIARNSSLSGFTFDGTTVTNGFHPMWQALTWFLFQGAVIDEALAQTRLVALVSLACVSTGIVACSVALYGFTRRRLLAVLTVPGVYYLLVGSLMDSHPAWADVSGMEAGLSVLFGGLVVLVLAAHLATDEPTLEALVSATPARSLYLHLGLLLPFLVLSRLDDVFVVATLGATALFARVPWSERIRAALLCGAPTAVVLSAYMLYSKASAGTFLPVSGMTKAGFVLAKNIYMTLAGAVPPVVDFKNALSAQPSDGAALNANLFRGAQLLYPAVLGGLFAWFERRAPRGSGRRALFFGLAAYVTIKAAYNLANVHLFHQSDWYYGFSFLLTSVFGVLLIAPAYDRAVPTRGAARALAAAYGIYVTVAAASFCTQKLHHAGRREHDFWRDRGAIAAALEAVHPEPRLIAFDDGITGYALPFPTIHGFTFAADLDTALARRDSRLLHHAYERGHDILTSANYMTLTSELASSDAIRRYLKASMLEDLVKAELDSLDFKLEYVSPTTYTPYFRFWPRLEETIPKPGNVSTVSVAPDP